MTLQRLRLRGFQIHRDLTLELSPTITTIVGPSDSGKSSILRAFRWLATNRPAGDEFIRDGGDICSVQLTLEDSTITRKRGRGVNKYRVDKIVMKAFGSQVPEDVAKLLNLDDINFQDQYDSPFWFSNTAAEVSRQLNQIVNLDLIDTTLANIASRLRKTQAEIHVVEDRLSSARVRRSNLSVAKDVDRRLAIVEGLEAAAEDKARRLASLRTLVEDARKYTTARDRYKERLAKTNVLDLGLAWQQLDRQRGRLESLLTEARSWQAKATTRPPDLKPLEKADQIWKAAQQSRDRFHQLYLLAREQEAQQCESSTVLEQTQATLARLLKRMRVCPLCGSRMSSPSSLPTSTSV